MLWAAVGRHGGGSGTHTMHALRMCSACVAQRRETALVHPQLLSLLHVRWQPISLQRWLDEHAAVGRLASMASKSMAGRRLFDAAAVGCPARESQAVEVCWGAVRGDCVACWSSISVSWYPVVFLIHFHSLASCVHYPTSDTNVTFWRFCRLQW